MIYFEKATSYLFKRGRLIPPDLLDDLGDIGAVKTVAYYTRVLTRDIRRLYDGEINTNLFVDNLAGYVERQLRRAWNEGMRANGLDPQNMTPAWEQMYQNAVVAEYQYIERLAGDILQAKRDGLPLDPYLSRAELWANRYREIVNMAMIETGGTVMLAWHLGATEAHCTDCLNYANQVKTADDWKAEKQPQSRALECGGWRCDCRLLPVTVGI